MERDTKGSPQQNAIIERFNRTYREDILDANIFHSIEHAQQLTDEWTTEYNTLREHEALGYQTPQKTIFTTCLNSRPLSPFS